MQKNDRKANEIRGRGRFSIDIQFFPCYNSGVNWEVHLSHSAVPSPEILHFLR